MNYIYKAKVTKVHSGDRFTADIDLGFGEIKKMELDLLGITAPPVGDPDGIASKKKLEDMIGGRTVVLDVRKSVVRESNGDPVAKYSASVTIPGVVLPVNDYMVRYGLAKMKWKS